MKNVNLPVTLDNPSIAWDFQITGFVYDAKTDSTKIILANSFFVVFPGKWNEERIREEIGAKGEPYEQPG